ncbi:MAG TPA: hypothetical protein VFF30_04250 [Nitrososphaerales archaeon]|nr:hypothetical protein [Nitrososphaerales archaeon]
MSEQSAATSSAIPAFNSKTMECIMCKEKMFYSEENLVHVCLNEKHGVLCFFEPDSCWFAASENTALELGKLGIKFHFIPKNVFENAGLADFKCEYSDDPGKTGQNASSS